MCRLVARLFADKRIAYDRCDAGRHPEYLHAYTVGWSVETQFNQPDDNRILGVLDEGPWARTPSTFVYWTQIYQTIQSPEGMAWNRPVVGKPASKCVDR
jgi:hypothetical protein